MTKEPRNFPGAYRKKRGAGPNPIPMLVALLTLSILLFCGLLLKLRTAPQEEPPQVPVTPPTTQAAETAQAETTAVTEAPTEAVTESTQVPEVAAYVPPTIPPESQLYSSADYLKVKPGDNLFTILPQNFFLGSGVGASSSELTLYEDGTFDGYYHDSDMGWKDTDYPHGTVTVCSFSGAFSKPVKVTDTIYSMSLLQLNYPSDVESQRIEDGFRYLQTKPPALKKGGKYYLYLPGCSYSVFTDDQLFYTGKFDKIPQGRFAIYPQDGSSNLGYWGHTKQDIFYLDNSNFAPPPPEHFSRK